MQHVIDDSVPPWQWIALRPLAPAQRRSLVESEVAVKHIVGGMVVLCLGLWGLVAWWPTFGMVMRGVVPFALLAVGLVAVVSGLRRISAHTEEGGQERETAHRSRSD